MRCIKKSFDFLYDLKDLELSVKYYIAEVNWVKRNWKPYYNHILNKLTGV